MKKNSLFLRLVIPILVIPVLVTQSISAFAVENSSSQTQTQAQVQTLPQITSQTVVPTTSQEAISACSGLYEKDSCQFHKNNSLLNGTCKILPSGNNSYELGCQPEQPTKNAAIDSGKDVPNAKEPHQHKHKRG